MWESQESLGCPACGGRKGVGEWCDYCGQKFPAVPKPDAWSRRIAAAFEVVKSGEAPCESKTRLEEKRKIPWPQSSEKEKEAVKALHIFEAWLAGSWAFVIAAYASGRPISELSLGVDLGLGLIAYGYLAKKLTD